MGRKVRHRLDFDRQRNLLGNDNVMIVGGNELECCDNDGVIRVVSDEPADRVFSGIRCYAVTGDTFGIIVAGYDCGYSMVEDRIPFIRWMRQQCQPKARRNKAQIRPHNTQHNRTGFDVGRGEGWK